MNCQKYTLSQAGNILVHCDRSNPLRKYGNQQIHSELSHLNYNLAPLHENMTGFQFMKSRCQDLKVLKRNDVNWMASWVVTLPADYTGNQKDFFKESYNFLENRYGKENVITSYVHLDETSPHMHFCFVPVVFDEKKQAYRVNAKKCISKIELQKIHPQMQEYLEEKLQTKVNILNGATKEGNKTITQLKAEESIKQKAIQELVESPTEEIKNIVIKQLPQNTYKYIIEEEKQNFKEYLKTDETFINDCKQELKDESEELSKVSEELEDLKIKKGSIEETIAKLDIEQNQKRKKLDDEYQEAKQKYDARILEMQRATLEEEKQKPNFIEKVYEKISKSKTIATVSFISFLITNRIHLDNLLYYTKKFRKTFDYYDKHRDEMKKDLEYFDKSYEISIEKVEASEQRDLDKEKENELEI